MKKVKRKKAECMKCPRWTSRKRVVMPDIHYLKAVPDLFILGESPGYNEDITGKPFVGKAGKLLRPVVESITDDYILDNPVRCFSESKPSPKQLEACKPNWESVVEQHKPKLIVALGNYAANALLGKKIKIGSYVGQSTSVCIKGKHYLVIFNYHPSHVLRSGGQKGGDHERVARAWADAWVLVADILENGIQKVPETVQFVDPRDIRQFLNVLSVGKGKIAYDYETTSADGDCLRPELCDDFRILSVGVAAEGMAGTSFVFDTVGKRAPAAISALWEKVISRRGHIAQNAKYEHRCNLKRFGFTSYLRDTMLAMNVIDELAGASLGAIGRYCKITWAGYKFEMAGAQKDPTSVPLDKLLQYSALEGRLTYEVWRKLFKEVCDLKREGVLRMQQNFAFHLAHVETDGMATDPGTVASVRSELEGDLERADKEFRSHPAIRKTERWAINNIKSFKKGHTFNPGSPVQMRHLCLDVLKLKVKPSKHKWKNGKKIAETISLDKRVLEKFEDDYPVLTNLAKVRSLRAMFTGFLDKYEDFTGPDGHIHTNYTQVVVVTGRLSSVAPNLQNVPLETVLRKVFCSRYKNGWLVAADYSQLEPVLLAGWSGDKAMCEALNAGLDLHRFVATKIYHVDYDKVTDRQRHIAKRRNLGSMYGQTAEGLADMTNISLDEAKEIIAIYDKEFIGAYKFRIAKGAEAFRCGMVKDLFGAVRHLRNAQSNNHIKKERALRQAGNFPIQSTGNRFHLIAMCLLRELLAERKLKAVVVGVEHDKIYTDCAGSDLEQGIETIQEAMLIHNKMPYWKDKPVPIKVDIKYGRNLFVIKKWKE